MQGIPLGNFFYGWRRKMGCITLVIACLLMIGWVRSIQVLDTTAFSIGDHLLVRMISRHSRIELQGFGSEPETILIANTVDLIWTKVPDPISGGNTYQNIACDEKTYQYQLRAYGFAIAGFENKRKQIRGSIWIAPYWSIVIPLTLLSTYLLLSKQRLRKAPEATNAPDEAQVTHA